MQLNKSYKLLSFLNRTHGCFSRAVFGGLGWLGTLLTTGSLVLARQSWQDFMADQFKTAFRRCGWYARTGWPGLTLIRDDFFDFTETLPFASRRAVHQFMSRRKSALKEYIFLSDMLYLKAADIHGAISDSPQLPPLIDDFYHTGTALLQSVPSVVQGNVVDLNDDTRERAGDFSREDAAAALDDFSRLLPLNEWRWYIISGTFLGLIREGNFLSHDYDVDVGIDAEGLDWLKLVSTLSSSPDFVVKKVDRHCVVERSGEGEYVLNTYPALIKIIHSSGVNVDVFLHYKEAAVRWHGSIIHRWNNSEFSLSEYSLAGVRVLGPAPAEKYLQENYGDWRTPVTDFECTTGTPNLVIAKNFLSMALFLKRLVVFRFTDAVRAEKHVDALIASGVLTRGDQGLILNRYI